MGMMIGNGFKLGLACAFAIGGCMTAFAQQAQLQAEKPDLKVSKRTLMEQYEPDLVISVDERLRLKRARMARVKERKEIIDTLDISERKKRRLLKELYRTPFSDEWEKVLADTEFEDPQ